MDESSDRYSRLQYRKLIAWPNRIRREAPLLEKVLGGPPARILDLGCGPGQHVRFLVERGYEAVGVDASESMIQACLELDTPAAARFVHGDIRRVDTLLDDTFDGAISLGNTLPHLLETADLERLFSGLRRRLRPGASLLIQMLNYERILERGERHLPLNFRPDDDGKGEIVFLRLMEPRDDGTMLFFPSTLRWRPDEDPPLEVVASKRVRLRAWMPDEIEAGLAGAGFADRRRLGGFDESPFEPAESRDLLVVAS